MARFRSSIWVRRYEPSGRGRKEEIRKGEREGGIDQI